MSQGWTKNWDFSEQGLGPVKLNICLGPGNCLDRVEFHFDDTFELARQWHESGQKLSDYLCGLKIDELAHLSADRPPHCGDENLQVIDLPWELFKQALISLTGAAKPLAQELSLPPNSLVCRCFGVFHEQIITTLKSGDARTLRDISRRLKVTSGCGSCRDDVLNILRKYRGQISGEIAGRLGRLENAEQASQPSVDEGKEVVPKWDEHGLRSRIGGETPADWIVKLQELMDEFWSDFSDREKDFSAPILAVLEGNQAVWLTRRPGPWAQKLEVEFTLYVEDKTSHFFTHSVQALKS